MERAADAPDARVRVPGRPRGERSRRRLPSSCPSRTQREDERIGVRGVAVADSGSSSSSWANHGAKVAANSASSEADSCPAEKPATQPRAEARPRPGAAAGARARERRRAAVLDDGHTLGVVLLEEAESLVEACPRRSCSAAPRRSRRAASSPGSRPVATTSRTSVLRVTTPTSRPSSQTKTARTSGRASSLTRLLRGRVRIERPRLGDHRLADAAHG